jgi:hypothetical protein
MNIYKKTIIGLIIIITLYLLWRLLDRRRKLMTQDQEGFSITGSSTADTELATLKQSSTTALSTMTGVNLTLPLKEFCIKGAYNAAYTGTYINLDMITYLLSRGCRYIDLEVYYVPTPSATPTTKMQPLVPMVGFSLDTTNTIIQSQNPVLLSTILAKILAGAFSMSPPNAGDPLFLNFRIKSNNTNVYKAVAASIQSTLQTKLYRGDPITADTPLSAIMGQIVICVDKTINPNWRQLSACSTNDKNCIDLTTLVNLESGSETFHQATYTQANNWCATPIQVADDNLHTNVKYMQLANPDTIASNKSNPNYGDFVFTHGYPIVPFRFYFNDQGLSDYEKFFEDNGGAFVPLAIAQTYFRKRMA